MKKRNTLSFWLPRILSVLAILFISMFALDSFAPNLTIWRQIGAFSIHLIPTYILTFFLIIAWKREKLGGILFITLAVLAIPFLFTINHSRNGFSLGTSIINVILIIFPFILIGALFLLSDYRTKSKE